MRQSLSSTSGKFYTTMQITETTQQNLNLWLGANLDSETRVKLDLLINEDPQKIQEAFYTKLSFGTGGLRGVMGIGTSRMNIYTIAMATQGLANYLLLQKGSHSVFISYDCRHNSRLFAEYAARVLAGNGISAILTKELRPTPIVSFGCRYLNCSAAIMITASHNPPEYNGFKVYWKSGGQVVSPHDQGIIEQVNQIVSLDQIKKADSLKHPLIQEVLEEVDNAYLNAIKTLQLTSTSNKKYGNHLHIIYSNLHGTGITLIPKAMKEWGFTQLTTVKEQDSPDGIFPTVKSPNPEERSALKIGIEKLEEQNADILIATDPDADRVGLAVNHQGETHILTGNQIGCLLLDHICRSLQDITLKTAFIKTIGTTELFKAIADFHNASCIDVLTGFKYIGEMIDEWKNNQSDFQFIFGAEESYGYLLGTHVRDKDAVISSTLIAEAALQAKLEGKTLIDHLHQLWKLYGIHVEKLGSLNFPETQEGHKQMEKGMKQLENNPPIEICGVPVTSIENYLSSVKTDVRTNKQEMLLLPKSNVLRFWLEDGSKLMIRPSGTEPKVKFYCGVKTDSYSSFEEGLSRLNIRANELIEFLKSLFLLNEP